MRKSLQIKRKKPFYKQKQFYTYLIGLFIISIMVLSVINLNSEAETAVEYNGLKFVQTQSGYLAYAENDVQVVVLSNPNELDVSLPVVDISSLKGLSKVYIAFNPYEEYQNAIYDFTNNINLARAVSSCYEDNDLCVDLPIKTCEDVTLDMGVIVFKQDNETLLSLNNNCLTIQGKDLLKVTDKLILDQYGQ